MRFIRFDRIPDEKDVTLKDKIRAERDGIFGLMVHYLQRLLTMREIPFAVPKARNHVSGSPLQMTQFGLL
jgi:hypothetical protein